VAACTRRKREEHADRALTSLGNLKVDERAQKLVAWALEVTKTLEALADLSNVCWTAPALSDVRPMRLEESGLTQAYKHAEFPVTKQFIEIFTETTESYSVDVAREESSVLRGGLLDPRDLQAPAYCDLQFADELPGVIVKCYAGTPVTHALAMQKVVLFDHVAQVTLAFPFEGGTLVVRNISAPVWTMARWLVDQPFAKRLRMACQLAEVVAEMNTLGVQVRIASIDAVFVTGEGEGARPLLPECTLTFRGQAALKCARQLREAVSVLITMPGVARGASEEAARALCDSNGAATTGGRALATELLCAECARTCLACAHIVYPNPTAPVTTPLGVECTAGHFMCDGCLGVNQTLTPVVAGLSRRRSHECDTARQFGLVHLQVPL